jgi:hypothetical protein
MENETNKNLYPDRKPSAVEVGYRSPGAMGPGLLSMNVPLAPHAPNRMTSPNEMGPGLLKTGNQALNPDPHPREPGGGTSGAKAGAVQRKNTYVDPKKDRVF